jgi:hypothetical protein
MGSGSFSSRGAYPWFTDVPGVERSPHIGHKQHLCSMADTGEVTLEQMKDLVRNPKFICKRCGRVAQNSDNLCEAEAID